MVDGADCDRLSELVSRIQVRNLGEGKSTSLFSGALLTFSCVAGQAQAVPYFPYEP